MGDRYTTTTLLLLQIFFQGSFNNGKCSYGQVFMVVQGTPLKIMY